jgi:hypothetical protein
MRSESDIKRELDLALHAAEEEYNRAESLEVKVDRLHYMVKRLRAAFDDLVSCMESMKGFPS